MLLLSGASSFRSFRICPREWASDETMKLYPAGREFFIYFQLLPACCLQIFNSGFLGAIQAGNNVALRCVCRCATSQSSVRIRPLSNVPSPTAAVCFPCDHMLVKPRSCGEIFFLFSRKGPVGACGSPPASNREKAWDMYFFLYLHLHSGNCKDVFASGTNLPAAVFAELWSVTAINPVL